jgi:hypothetical protein
MIKNTEQIKSRHRWSEFERRQEASEDQVQSLTTTKILEALSVPFDRAELRAELKRRRERLRYAKLMANPRTRSIYRERKRTERLNRTWSI